MRSAPGVHLVAMGDLFPDRLASSRGYLASTKLDGYRVQDARCFTGFDAYRRVLDCDVDLVLLTTPPGFRPQHAAAAVEAGKHVFMEKPVAVDAPGVRQVIAAGERAAAQGLAMLAGTQYRHHEKFVQGVAHVHAGAIGAILAGRAYYNVGGLWHRGREADWSEMEYQLRNWYYQCWLSGDHIVEQHIHTIDVCNWVMGGPPVRAVAVGGRIARTDPKFGNIYDHFCVDYEYPGGVHVTSMCRQIDRTAAHVGAYFQGTTGTFAPYQGVVQGPEPWKYAGEATLGTSYRQEHTDLIASIRAGQPINEARQVAESTLTAILGREAAYTGESIELAALMASDLRLGPETIAFGDAAQRPVPIPGRNR
jgi:predicted dehydrogenase